MIDDVRDILSRSSETLARDAIGVAAIGIVMVVALYLPSFF